MLEPLSKDRTIAFVMSARIGDTLISMVVVRNLIDHGFKVTVFSDHLAALRAWFPRFPILPAVTPADAQALLGGYDTVLHAYAADVVGDLRTWHRDVHVMDEWPVYRQIKPMVDIQIDICTSRFGLSTTVRDNGLQIPQNVDTVVNCRRAVIHPSASDTRKQWLPKRFLRLACHLRDRGYDPCFVIAPNERAQWAWVEAHGFRLVSHANLGELAQWLVTAGVFIGNDSGIAHLASNLGVPVVSLAMRPRIARRWTPGWAPSLTLTPLPLVPGRWPKEVLWKYLLPLAKVTRAVEALRKQMAKTPRAFGAEPRATREAIVVQRARLAPFSGLRGRMLAFAASRTPVAASCPAETPDRGSSI